MLQGIIINQGIVFASKWWKLTMTKNKIDYCMTTTYYFQVNRKVERTNQELKQYLQKYANYQQDKWPELVPLTKYTYSTIKTQKTNFTSYQVVYSRNLTIHVAPEEPSQVAINKIKSVVYKNLLFS